VTLEELGNLGDLIAAIATLITLVYLAVQIRLNTKSLQGSTAQSHVHLELDTGTLVIQNASVYLRGCKDLSDLNEEERIVFERIVTAEMSLLSSAFIQCQNGLMDDFDPFIADWKLTYLPHPGFQSVWAAQKDTYPPEFGQYLDEVGKATPVVAKGAGT
jgi:hypothetical protein